MSIQLHAESLFEHLRHICERPRMFAPDFSITHLLMFIYGYEAAVGDAKLPSQHEQFREWIYARHPEWRDSSMAWPGHVLADCGGNLESALDAIIVLLDEFLATDGAEFAKSATRQSYYTPQELKR
jgi:hypothetical protein